MSWPKKSTTWPLVIVGRMWLAPVLNPSDYELDTEMLIETLGRLVNSGPEILIPCGWLSRSYRIRCGAAKLIKSRAVMIFVLFQKGGKCF